MVEKIKPNATIKYSVGDDGWDEYYDVGYSCPQCGKNLMRDEIACVNCGAFFDWSKKAHIEVRREIVWE